MTIAAALEKITEQTGNKFRFESLPNKELMLDLEDVTFWDAVDEILDAGNLDVEAFAETAGALKLRLGKQVLECGLPMVCMSSPFAWR